MPATRENKKGETRSDKEQKAEPGQKRDNLLTRPHVQESPHDLRPLLPVRQASSHSPKRGVGGRICLPIFLVIAPMRSCSMSPNHTTLER